MLAPAKQGYGGSYPNHFVDEVYSVLKVIPFCFLVIIYWTVYAQVRLFRKSCYTKNKEIDLFHSIFVG